MIDKYTKLKQVDPEDNQTLLGTYTSLGKRLVATEVLKDLDKLETNHNEEDVDYIDSLENLLIFMCQTYEEQRGVMFELAKEGNMEPLLRVPTIQGSHNLIPIEYLAKKEFNHPKHSFKDVENKLDKK